MSEESSSFDLLAFWRYLKSQVLVFFVVTFVAALLGGGLLFIQYPGAFSADPPKKLVEYRLNIEADPALEPTLKLLNIDYATYTRGYVHSYDEVMRISAAANDRIGRQDTETEAVERILFILKKGWFTESEPGSGVITLVLRYDDDKFARNYMEEWFVQMSGHLRNELIGGISVYIENTLPHHASLNLTDQSKIAGQLLPVVLKDFTDNPGKKTIVRLGPIEADPFVQQIPKLGLANVNAVLVLLFSSVFISLCLSALRFYASSRKGKKV